jgi:hypothetical protein
MAHFYGVVNGQAKTQATRRGSKSQGLITKAASWHGAIQVYVYHNNETGKDEYVVEQTPWHGAGVSKVIAKGVIGE